MFSMALLIFLAPDVYAINVNDYWFDNTEMNTFSNYVLYKWSDNLNFSEFPTVHSELRTSSQYGESSVSYYGISSAGSNNAFSIDSSGVSFAFSLDQRLSTDYLYSVSTYVCSSSTLSSTSSHLTVAPGDVSSVSASTKYSKTTRTSLSTVYTSSDVHMNFNNCYIYTSLVVPFQEGAWASLKLTSPSSFNVKLTFLGFSVTPVGLYSDTIKDILDGVIDSSGLASASSVQQVQESVNEVKDEMEKANDTLDDMNNADISDSDKELPDDSSYRDYESSESTLKDKVNQADMSSLSIGIDGNSSKFVWGKITQLIKSNSVVFGMFISILSIGIIKLALGR